MERPRPRLSEKVSPQSARRSRNSPLAHSRMPLHGTPSRGQACSWVQDSPRAAVVKLRSSRLDSSSQVYCEVKSCVSCAICAIDRGDDCGGRTLLTHARLSRAPRGPLCKLYGANDRAAGPTPRSGPTRRACADRSCGAVRAESDRNLMNDAGTRAGAKKARADWATADTRLIGATRSGAGAPSHGSLSTYGGRRVEGGALPPRNACHNTPSPPVGIDARGHGGGVVANVGLRLGHRVACMKARG